MKTKAIMGAIAIFALGALIATMSWEDAVAPRPDHTSATRPAPATRFGDGAYHVGTHILPGTYQAFPDDDCSWRKRDDFGGAPGSGAGGEPVIVTIDADDGIFRSDGCGTWEKVD